MAAPAPQRRRPVEVIDLVSDDDDDDSSSLESDQPPPPPLLAPQLNAPMDLDSDTASVRYHTPRIQSETPSSDVLGDHARPFIHNRPPSGTILNLDGEEIFIPDEDEPPEAGINDAYYANVARDREIALALDQDQAITADECLQRVLDIFPDISHDYVYDLYNEFDREGDYETLPGSARLDNIIEQLISGMSYPKQEKGKKRKREDPIEEDPDKKWEREDRIPLPSFLKAPMQLILKAEFPDIPIQYIHDTLAAQRHLYHAYLALAKAKDSSDRGNRPYGKGRPSSKTLADAPTVAANHGWPELLDELNAARKRTQAIKNERAAAEIKKQAEQENLRRAMNAGETAECSACFDDLPMNRQIYCNGFDTHFTCFECAETYIKSEVGESRCRVLCPAGCGAGFVNHQLNLLSDKQSLEKLAQLQQEKDIRDAGLDDLDECPFCDYKAILPPVEEDFEFRCANPECEKVSCRRCKAISHIPISCEQHAKDNKINSRHKIEEAMTAALVRSCNKCKKQFIKEYGCNKMTCPSCGNLQCYVCSATLKDYNHFDQNHPGRPIAVNPSGTSKPCPLYDNVEERHEREVKAAETAARAQVVQDNPDVTAEDLEIKVSEAVKTATANRVRQAGAQGGGYMVAGFAAPPPPPPPPIPPMNGGFGVFGVDGVDDFMFPDIEEERDGARRRANRVAERRRRDAELLVNLRRQDERFPVAGRNAPVAQVVPLGQPVGALQGFIPVLGYQPAQVAQQPAIAAPRQADPMYAAPQGFGFGNNAFDYDAAREINHIFPNPQMNREANEQARADLHNAFARNNHNQYQAQPPGNRAEWQQAFNPGIRDQRQNFQQFEMLRQPHEQHMQLRENMRQQGLQAQAARGHRRPQYQ